MKKYLSILLFIPCFCLAQYKKGSTPTFFDTTIFYVDNDTLKYKPKPDTIPIIGNGTIENPFIIDTSTEWLSGDPRDTIPLPYGVYSIIDDNGYQHVYIDTTILQLKSKKNGRERVSRIKGKTSRGQRFKK